MSNAKRAVESATNREPGRPTFDPRLVATGFLGAGVVYLAYYPSDAASVANGDALWFAMLSLATCLFTFVVRTTGSNESDGSRWLSIDRCLDIAVWLLALWIMIAAFANSGVGNLRMATNEAWLWISGAAMFTAVRRLSANLQTRKAVAVLMVICATGLAVHALHQEWVTLPLNRAAFEEDPERVLEAAGYDAPKSSAERVIFAGRLMDGGPTATFALANSLAAVLIAGVLLAAGVVRFSLTRLSYLQLVVWIFVAVLCAVGLWVTHSRSAVAASLLGATLICLDGDTTLSRAISKRRTMLLAGAVAASGFGGVVWLVNRDLFFSAPASVMFRLQYWRATLQMVLDRPWFGAGPGNFQSMYDRYRDATTSEQIADPHNLFFETLASGGWIGLTLLVVCITLVCKAIAAGKKELPCDAEAIDGDYGRSVWIGASVSLGLVWLFGFASRQLPDVEASLFVLPVVFAAGFVLVPSVKNVESHCLDRLMLIVLLMVGLHLMFSGGWTVPGVAIVIWISAGIQAPIEMPRPSSRYFGASIWIGGLCVALMGLLFFMSLRPVQSAGQSMAVATRAIEDGQYRLAERRMRSAAMADRWSPQANLGLADLLRWRLIQEDLPIRRTQWENELEQARRRGGQNPTLLRAIGSQQTHLFQRYGKSEDLVAAGETFETAYNWSPVNQWMIAQLASIVAAQGDMQRCKELTDEAKRLSELGINTERRFRFQLIYPAKFFGESAKQGAIRRSAEAVLSEPG